MKTQVTESQNAILQSLAKGCKVIGYSQDRWLLHSPYYYAGKVRYTSANDSVYSEDVQALVAAGLCTVTAEDELVLIQRG